MSKGEPPPFHVGFLWPTAQGWEILCAQCRYCFEIEWDGSVEGLAGTGQAHVTIDPDVIASHVEHRVSIPFIQWANNSTALAEFITECQDDN